ncbi:MAG: ComEC/Rec2 family competence protein [Pyrinomonadaceae bacterium]
MTGLPPKGLARSPLLTLAVSLSIGILLGHYLAGQHRASFTIGIVFLISASMAAASYAVRRKPELATLFLTTLFLIAGTVLSLIENEPVASNRLSRMYDEGVISVGEPVELTGTIEGQPEPAPQSFYLTLKAQRMRIKGIDFDVTGSILLRARLATDQVKNEYDALKLRHGARIRVMTSLDREDDFRNPGVMPFTEYLERKGFDATGVIKSPLLIERLDDGPVVLPLAWLYDWRELLQQKFHQLFSPETAGVLDAALLGNHYNISRGAAERFRAGGTFHVLVISGLQIAFIGGVALVIVKWFTRRRVFQFLIAAALLWSYTVAVGADASVTRSALMFTVLVLAPVVSRRANTLNSLGGAAIALLVWHPDDLFDPSFQLTFLSVLSIVTIAVPLINRLQQVGSWRPAYETPYPPDCAPWFRVVAESLFWSERKWKADMAKSNIRYRLFKTSLAARLERWRVQRLARFAANAIIVSTSVQIGMLPVLIIYFHRVSFAALLLNIFVGLLMALLSLVALAATLISAVSQGLATPLIMVAEKTNWLMIHLIDPFSSVGFASVRGPHYRGWLTGIYVLYFLSLGFLVFALARWKPLRLNADAKRKVFARRYATIATVVFSILALIIIAPPFGSPRPDGRLHVEYLDVGQGDSALVTLPDGTTLLIDGGGRPNIDWNRSDGADADETFERDARSVGERVVSEYLWARGLDRVDYLLATHADADHIDGLDDVARNFKVRSAIVARTPTDDPGFARFAETMKQMQVPIERVGGGDVLRFGLVSAEVLWPRAANDDTAPSRNNDSIVLRLRYGDQVLLFTGDIEKEAESALLSQGYDLHSNIVKVAHHGSKTSSVEPFVAATQPSVAIISVGRNSVFGHPNKDVVERWRASGAQVMTTGEKGTISVVTDGRSLEVRNFVRD